MILRSYLIHKVTHDVINVLRMGLSYRDYVVDVILILFLTVRTVRYCLIVNYYPIFAFVLSIYIRHILYIYLIFLDRYRLLLLLNFRYEFLWCWILRNYNLVFQYNLISQILIFRISYFFYLWISILLLRFFKDVSYTFTFLSFNLTLQCWSRYEMTLRKVLYVLIDLISAYLVLQK